MIGLRGRRTAMRGCDVPLLWEPYRTPPISLYPENPGHTDSFWQAVEGLEVTPFRSLIKDNLFFVSGEYAHRAEGIKIYGNYPLYEGPKKVNCLLPTSEFWVDTSFAEITGNTFTGLKPTQIVNEIVREHHKNCLTPDPQNGPSTGNYVEWDNVISIQDPNAPV